MSLEGSHTITNDNVDSLTKYVTDRVVADLNQQLNKVVSDARTALNTEIERKINAKLKNLKPPSFFERLVERASKWNW